MLHKLTGGWHQRARGGNINCHSCRLTVGWQRTYNRGKPEPGEGCTPEVLVTKRCVRRLSTGRNWRGQVARATRSTAEGLPGVKQLTATTGRGNFPQFASRQILFLTV